MSGTFAAKIKADEGIFPITQVQALNWLLLVAMTISALFFFSKDFAVGLVVGGVLANGSFLLLKRNLTRIFQGPVQVAKVRFFLSYYIRLTILACILFWLVRHFQINIFGLLAGLSTVVASIVLVAAVEARKLYFQAKEAA